MTRTGKAEMAIARRMGYSAGRRGEPYRPFPGTEETTAAYRDGYNAGAHARMLDHLGEPAAEFSVDFA